MSADDEFLEEFETEDLGDAILKSGSGVMIPGKKSKKQHPTSVVLSDKLISDLRAKGSKRGIGYQTMMKIILMENISKY